MLRTKAIPIGSTVVTVVALSVAMVGCASASPATSALTTVATTVAASSMTSVSTTAAPTTIAPTTVPGTTTPTTTVDDQLRGAMDRAQVVMRACLKSLPTPCDDAELETAFVGVHLGVFRDFSASGMSIEREDDLTWTIMDGPNLVGSDLAVATVCTFDPLVVTFADGRFDDDAVYYGQEWHLLPVGDTWKVSEIINQSEGATEAEGCAE